MSILARFLMRGHWRVAIRDLFPGILPSDLDALAILIEADKFVTDAGEPHPALINWVAGVVDRRRGDGGAVVIVAPVTTLAPSGAEVML